MFTDNPKPSVEDGYCPHYNGNIESFCYDAGECEGWKVWACMTCGYFYFTDPYHPEVLGPTVTFTLAEALQAYNWAMKGKDDSVLLVKSLEDLVNFYVKQGGYHLNEAIDRTQKELEKIATGTQYMSTRAVLVRTLMSYMVRHTASRQSAFAEVRHILSDIERDIEF